MAEWGVRRMDTYDAKQWTVEVELFELTPAAAGWLRQLGLSYSDILHFLALANGQRFGAAFVMSGFEMIKAPTKGALVEQINHRLADGGRQLGERIAEHFVKLPIDG